MPEQEGGGAQDFDWVEDLKLLDIIGLSASNILMESYKQEQRQKKLKQR